MTVVPVSSIDEELTRRALRHAVDGTTDMADRVLKVPLHYYRDPKITEIEESQILRRVPLAIARRAGQPPSLPSGADRDGWRDREGSSWRSCGQATP